MLPQRHPVDLIRAWKNLTCQFNQVAVKFCFPWTSLCFLFLFSKVGRQLAWDLKVTCPAENLLQCPGWLDGIFFEPCSCLFVDANLYAYHFSSKELLKASKLAIEDIYILVRTLQIYYYYRYIILIFMNLNVVEVQWSWNQWK